MLALAATLGLVAPAVAEDYAMVVTGASGGEAYAAKYDRWRTTFVSLLREKFGYPADHVFVLVERPDGSAGPATRDGVRRLFAALQARVTKDDRLLVLLIGHETVLDNDDAKFNLVGPDMRAGEWAELLKPIAARLVFVDGSSASAPFLHKLSAPGRIVVTATDSSAQGYETVFPEFFIRAFTDAAADADKNGRVSILEAFDYASAAVRQSYEEKGQLQTERALIDDNGDGVGRESRSPGADGLLARTAFLQAAEVGPDVASGELRRQQAALEAQIETLKSKRASMPADAYQTELERLLTELAHISAQIRSTR
jgi:hypothetical protein